MLQSPDAESDCRRQCSGRRVVFGREEVPAVVYLTSFGVSYWFVPSARFECPTCHLLPSSVLYSILPSFSLTESTMILPFGVMVDACRALKYSSGDMSLGLVPPLQPTMTAAIVVRRYA